MTQECNSKIFIDFWNDGAALIKAVLTLNDVNNELWTPVFSQCVELLAKLNDYSLSLQVVDQLFKGQPDISGDIKQLYIGVEMCRKGQYVKDFEWMEGVIGRMNQYWRLCSFAETAEAFLQIRDALTLTGDFGLVERIASQVRHSLHSNDSCKNPQNRVLNQYVHTINTCFQYRIWICKMATSPTPVDH